MDIVIIEEGNMGGIFYILEHGSEFITGFETVKEAMEYREHFLSPEWGIRRIYKSDYQNMEEGQA